MKKIILCCSFLIGLSAQAKPGGYLVDMEELKACFSNTNWGSLIDPKTPNIPQARFIDDLHPEEGSKVTYEINTLFIPKQVRGKAKVHMIQYRPGDRAVQRALGGKHTIHPSTATLPGTVYNCNPGSTGKNFAIGGDCYSGDKENGRPCNMARINLSVVLNRDRSLSVCPSMKRDDLSIAQDVNSSRLPEADAAELARAAVLERLTFLKNMIVQNKVQNLNLMKSTFVRAASGPCTKIFQASYNDSIARASKDLLCVVEPSHRTCLSNVVPGVSNDQHMEP